MTDTRELLEKAARACGWSAWQSKHRYWNVTKPDGSTVAVCDNWHQFDSVTGEVLPQPTAGDAFIEAGFNPLTNSGDCAEMNAENINTTWLDGSVLAESVELDNNGFALFSKIAKFREHNNDPLAAWRYASTVVAGMMGENR
jgi:hypothetical protein